MPPDYKGLKKSKFLVQITLEHIGDTRIAWVSFTLIILSKYPFYQAPRFEFELAIFKTSLFSDVSYLYLRIGERTLSFLGARLKY